MTTARVTPVSETRGKSEPAVEPAGTEIGASDASPDPDSIKGSRRPAPAGVEWLQQLDNALGLAERALLCVFLVVLIGIGSGQALATQLGSSWAWSEELIRYSVFFIAMTGAALSAQTEQLISMDFVTRLLPADRRAWLRLLLRLFTISMCILLVIGGNSLSQETGDETGHLIPPALGLLAIPIGAGLIALHVLLHFIVDVLYLGSGRTPPEQRQLSAH